MLQQFCASKSLNEKDEPWLRLRSNNSPVTLKGKREGVARPHETIAEQPNEVVGLLLRSWENACFDDRLALRDDWCIWGNAGLSTDRVTEDSSISSKASDQTRK